ncbi:MAG: PfkB family carbohydrate kinase [Desulfosarcinaceae bacterium]|nr:PfkB family carbohydrate kinase [Desulfosarcinaceae bacterium]
MAKIVCVGLACLDYLFQVAELPKGGGKYFAQNFAAAAGGPAAVASLAVAALGHEARFFGRLGDDAVGRDILRHLTVRGVDAAGVRLIPGQTSQVSAVMVDPAGERQIVNYSSAQLDPDPAWLPAAVIAEADFVLTDVRWPEGAAAALQLARRHGVPSLIDADIAPVDTGDLVQLATYAVYSERGLAQVSGVRDLEKGLRRVTRQGTRFAAVTAGERGTYWLSDGQLRHCPAVQIAAVDTCGAGDVFHGAFAVAMVEQMEMADAMRFAAATAALKCQSFGGSAGVPNRSAVNRHLSAAGR